MADEPRPLATAAVCKWCQREIWWTLESKRPLNKDATVHACAEWRVATWKLTEITCRWCGKTLMWARPGSGSRRPVELDGSAHDCEKYIPEAILAHPEGRERPPRHRRSLERRPRGPAQEVEVTQVTAADGFEDDVPMAA